MSISFVCVCGKHLRARDEMAGRRSMCPRCGAPVGVPPRQNAQPGAPAGLLLPAERLHRRKIVLPGDESYQVARQALAGRTLAPPARTLPANFDKRLRLDDPGPPEKDRSPSRARSRDDIGPADAVLYLVRALPRIVMLAGILTTLTVAAARLWERLPDFEMNALSSAAGYTLCLVIAFAALAWAGGFLQCVLAANAAGMVRTVPRLGDAAAEGAAGAATWVFAFVTGPLVVVVGARSFWLYAGDLKLIDALVLVDMLTIAAGYWILALVAASRGEGILDANPVRVAALVERLGKRAILAVCGAALAWTLAGVLGMSGAAALSDHFARGVLLIGAAWVVCLASGSLAMSLLGVWCCRMGS